MFSSKWNTYTSSCISITVDRRIQSFLPNGVICIFTTGIWLASKCQILSKFSTVKLDMRNRIKYMLYSSSQFAVAVIKLKTSFLRQTIRKRNIAFVCIFISPSSSSSPCLKIHPVLTFRMLTSDNMSNKVTLCNYLSMDGRFACSSLLVLMMLPLLQILRQCKHQPTQ